MTTRADQIAFCEKWGKYALPETAAMFRSIAETLRADEQQQRITSLAVPLEEELAIAIDEMLKHLATEQGFTLAGIARLFMEVQRRMADDWVEIGRLRLECKGLRADREAAPAPPQNAVLRELDSYRTSIREAFDEGFALSKMNGPIEAAWERSESRQEEHAFAFTRISIGAIVKSAARPGVAVAPKEPSR